MIHFQNFWRRVVLLIYVVISKYLNFSKNKINKKREKKNQKGLQAVIYIICRINIKFVRFYLTLHLSTTENQK